jgi:hypothetical protein
METPKETFMCKQPLPHQMNYKTDQVLLPLSTKQQKMHTLAIPFLHYPQGPLNACAELQPHHVQLQFNEDM